MVVIAHPGVVDIWKTLVLVVQGENELVVRCSRTVDTVVDSVCVSEILVIVGWVYRINVVTAW